MQVENTWLLKRQTLSKPCCLPPVTTLLRTVSAAPFSLLYTLHFTLSSSYFSVHENILYFGFRNEFGIYILSSVPQLENSNGILFGTPYRLRPNVAVLRGKLLEKCPKNLEVTKFLLHYHKIASYFFGREHLSYP